MKMGKLFERISVLFLLLTFVSLFSRIGYGKVFFFIFINDPQKKDLLEFCFVCLFRFVLFWSNGGTNCSYLSYYKAVNWHR